MQPELNAEVAFPIHPWMFHQCVWAFFICPFKKRLVGGIITCKRPSKSISKLGRKKNVKIVSK